MNTTRLHRVFRGARGPIILACVLSAVPARAQCPLVRYEFDGTLTERQSSDPVAGASIFLFLDDRQGTWAAGQDTKYPDFFTSDAAGRFAGAAFFEPAGRGGRCTGQPRRLTIVVTTPGYLSKRIEVDLKPLLLDREGEGAVELPAIVLARAKENRGGGTP